MTQERHNVRVRRDRASGRSGQRFPVRSRGGSSVAENRLLASLPGALLVELRPYLEPVSLRAGEVIHAPGQCLDFLYFPTTAIVSLICTLEQGTTTETGLIGNEGAIGIALILGSTSTQSEAVVAVAGEACRIRATRLLQEFQHNEPLRALLLRYTQALITQISQTAVCNRLHHVDARLCRWLLLARDRTRARKIPITQEFIARMLGVRRECVNQAIHRLQRAGLVNNGRGHIEILDPAGLEAAVCECYGVVRTEFDRLRGWQPES